MRPQWLCNSLKTIRFDVQKRCGLGYHKMAGSQDKQEASSNLLQDFLVAPSFN